MRTQITIRIEEATEQQLAKMADETGSTVAGVARAIIENHLKGANKMSAIKPPVKTSYVAILRGSTGAGWRGDSIEFRFAAKSPQRAKARATELARDEWRDGSARLSIYLKDGDSIETEVPIMVANQTHCGNWSWATL